MSSVKEIVEEAIANNKVIVFAKSYCPYCKKAEALFTRLLVEYVAIYLDLHSQGEEIQAYLLDKTGQRTVPNIFIDQKHIGGSDDLTKLETSGELKKLLKL